MDSCWDRAGAEKSPWPDGAEQRLAGDGDVAKGISDATRALEGLDGRAAEPGVGAIDGEGVGGVLGLLQ